MRSFLRVLRARRLTANQQSSNLAKRLNGSVSQSTSQIVAAKCLTAIKDCREFAIRHRFALSLLPGIVVALITSFTEFTLLNSGARAFFLWSPAELGIWIALLIAGPAIVSNREMRRAHFQLELANTVEARRRAIAAIGMAASWDLDLDRLYQRISQDLRTVVRYDRLTITSVLSDGRMAVEFVSGDPNHGPEAGTALLSGAVEPDGIYPEHLGRYVSRLTATMPALDGTITNRRASGPDYTPEDLETLRQTVAQISPGIANAVMFRSSERRVSERTALAEIGRTATSVSDPQAIIDGVSQSLESLIDHEHLGVILADDRNRSERKGIVAHWRSATLDTWNVGEQLDIDFGAVNPGVVVADGMPGFVTQVPLRTSSDEAIFWLQAPLVVQEDVIGLLVVGSERAGAIDQDGVTLLLSVCLQIAPAIQNATLTARLHRQAEERRAVARIGLAATSEHDLETIYDRVGEELAEILHFDRLAISYVRSDDLDEEVVYTAGDGRITGDSPETSVITAPLGTESSIIGHISISSQGAEPYAPEDLDLLERIAVQVTPAIRNARMITAERELRETLDRQNNELFEANNARKQFLSTVSHELKTPLTIISGFVDLLDAPDEDVSESERRETLGIIRRNANQLNVLINDILDISRLDAGTFKLDSAPFSVRELISDLEASFQSLLRTKTQTLRVRVPDDDVWITADRSRISQVITNLLSNATKYSPEETEIALSAEVAGDHLNLTVADQGVGMTENEQKELFTPFFRADNETTRSVAGTGLGLVIAKSITELHGGTIRLEGQRGVGTTIELSLPGLTAPELVPVDLPEEELIQGSRLWPDGPPDELDLGAD